MPLRAGSSPEIIEYNIRQLVKDGYPQRQAQAIAYDKAKQSRAPKRKRKKRRKKKR